MRQFRKAEERRGRGAERELHGAEALFDFILGIGHRLLDEVGVRPGMRPDRVTLRGHLLENLGMPHRMLADREERTLRALRRERAQHGGRIHRPGPVVEGQHDLVGLQKIVHLEVLEAEPRSARGIDLNRTAHAHHVRLLRTVRRGGSRDRPGLLRVHGACQQHRQHKRGNRSNAHRTPQDLLLCSAQRASPKGLPALKENCPKR